MSKESDEYGTPFELYDYLNKRFHFSLDPCTTKDNPLKTVHFLTKEDSGLESVWPGPVFMNPPYSQVTPWVKKAYTTSLEGDLVVGLLRNDRSTKWWHQWVANKALVIDVPYRIKFRKPSEPEAKLAAYDFPSAIVIWWGEL